MTKLKTFGFCVAVVFCFVPSAHGVTIIDQNFDGASFPTGLDIGPIAEVGVGNGTSPDGRVWSRGGDPPAGEMTISDEQSVSANNALRVERIVGAIAPKVDVYDAFGIDVTAPTNFEFSVQYRRTADAGVSIMVGDNAQQFGQIALDILSGTGRINDFWSGIDLNPGEVLDVDTWYKLRMDISITSTAPAPLAGSYDLYVTEEGMPEALWGSSSAAFGSNASIISTITLFPAITGPGGGKISYFDDVSLEGDQIPNTGDFDTDADIDGNDFLFWQRNLRDAPNLSVWEGNFGTLLPLEAAVAASSAAVPEPGSLAMFVFAFACLLGSTDKVFQRRKQVVRCVR